jgi:hypothetical protein
MTTALSKFTNDFNALRQDIKSIGNQMTKLEEMEDDSASRRGGSEYGGATSVKGGSGWT